MGNLRPTDPPVPSQQPNELHELYDSPTRQPPPPIPLERTNAAQTQNHRTSPNPTPRARPPKSTRGLVSLPPNPRPRVRAKSRRRRRRPSAVAIINRRARPNQRSEERSLPYHGSLSGPEKARAAYHSAARRPTAPQTRFSRPRPHAPLPARKLRSAIERVYSEDADIGARLSRRAGFAVCTVVWE